MEARLTGVGGGFYLSDVADVAQLVEQLPCKQQVVGSSPTVSSSGAG